MRKVLRSNVFGYVVAIIATALAATISVTLDPAIGRALSYFFFILAVTVAAWIGGVHSGLATTVLSAATCAILFTERADWNFPLGLEAVRLLAFVVASLLVSWTGGQLHSSQRRLQIERRRLRKTNWAAEREQRQQLELVTNNASVLLTHCDRHGRYRFVNKPYAQLFGLTPDQVIGKHISELVGQKTYALVKPQVEAALAGRHVEFDLVVPSPLGVAQSLHIRYQPEFVKGQVIGFVGAIIDMTESKLLGEALRESEKQFRQLADSMPQIVWAAQPDGFIDYYNERWYEYTGFARGDFGQQSWELLLHPDDLQRALDTYTYCVRTGRLYQIEYRFRDRVTGDYRWFLGRALPVRDETGQIVRWFGTCTDIDDTKQLEQAERDQNRLLRAVTDNATTAIFMMDEQNRCTFLNPAAEAMTGYTLAEAEGRAVQELFYGKDPPDARPALVDSLCARPGPANFEIKGHEDVFTRKDGTLFPVTCNIRTILSDGAPTGAVVEVRDITKEKEDAQRIDRLMQDLRDADRRKDEFLATLAHELRNPLAPMRNAVYLLRLKGDQNPDLQWSRDVIQRQVDHMIRLVDDLLDISRITRDKLQLRQERVELGAVVQAAVESIRPLMREYGHELTIALPPHPVALSADPIRLGQVFINLLNNAAKYTKPGGQVSLTAELQGPQVVVRVKDSGIGIAPEQIEHLFDMFYQADRSLERSHGGLGIGLSLVRRLIEMHGGSVEVDSEGVGKGSEFRIRVPALVDAEEAQSAFPRNADEQSMISSRRILVVDDNRDSAVSLAMLLKMTGHQVQTAFDGAAGVEMAASFLPDAILLDLAMPKLNGYDACQKIREQPWGKNVLLIAMTGWGQDEDRRRTALAGFNAHLVKPIEQAALQTILSNLQPPA